MTAKEYIEKNNQGSFGLTQEALMIEFAKHHVTEALKQASSKMKTMHHKANVLTSYPLENIK